jgi:radical SAM protein with 4Fe4S-binding SPASM domain
MKRVIATIGLIVFGLLFFWLFGLKLILKLSKGRSGPCPSSLGWLVDLPIRRRYMRPVLERAGLRPGETVLELGPGPGAFTVDAAERLGPDGELIAVDIQPEMIAQVEERVRQAGLTNVETHVASAYELPMEDESVDRACESCRWLPICNRGCPLMRDHNPQRDATGHRSHYLCSAYRQIFRHAEERLRELAVRVPTPPANEQNLPASEWN